MILFLRCKLPSLKPFFRSYASHSGSGPARDKLRAIPFTQHVKASDKIFEDYHGKGFFSARVKTTGPPEEIFLPFWIVSARVRVEIVQAQVGHRVLRNRYNPATRRNEVGYDTHWSWVNEHYRWSHEYSPLEHVGMHIYGSHKYRRGLVNAIRSCQSLQEATQFTPQLLDRPAYSDLTAAYRNINRKVDPYYLYPTTALRFARSYIRDSEEAYADDFLRRKYSADDTRLVQVEIHVDDIHCAPVYYPAYVYTVHYLGRNLRTFVNGHDLRVGGIQVYDPNRVAIASVVGMATLMTMTGGVGIGGMSGSFWIGIVLPTVIASLVSVYSPIISLRFRDWKRQQEIRSQEHDPHIWDSDWVKAFNAFEDQYRYRTWKQDHQSQSERRTWGDTSSDLDPKGYYKALGVSTKASTADIQSAFRGLAMKHHPDRYSDPNDKKKATDRFKAISAAYSVLRDPKKRKAYDHDGR
ncbi:DnaJ-domain-containing protein [Lichtheimia hyalospora FSU 10163]|nr:DnaJ-domain-containing protein [Lichtheimia hyalospora FSU 10163]